MSLIDDAINLQQKPGSPCTVANLATADPALHAELLEAIGTTVHATAIHKALQGRGYHITAETITRHRRNECQRCR